MLPKTLPDVIRLLSGKLTLENTDAQVLTFRVTGDDTNVRVKTRFTSEPVEVRIAKVTNLDDPDVPGSLPSGGWKFDAGHVVFPNFSTLASGVPYDVRIVVLGGG